MHGVGSADLVEAFAACRSVRSLVGRMGTLREYVALFGPTDGAAAHAVHVERAAAPEPVRVEATVAAVPVVFTERTMLASSRRARTAVACSGARVVSAIWDGMAPIVAFGMRMGAVARGLLSAKQAHEAIAMRWALVHERSARVVAAGSADIGFATEADALAAIDNPEAWGGQTHLPELLDAPGGAPFLRFPEVWVAVALGGAWMLPGDELAVRVHCETHCQTLTQAFAAVRVVFPVTGARVD